MTERLVALERDGALRLYTVNGEGPVEVGHLMVGALDAHMAAMVAAAFSDLREVVRNGQLPPSRPPVVYNRAEPPPPRALNRSHAVRGEVTLRVLSFMEQGGSYLMREVAEGLGMPAKQVSNALAHLRLAGRVVSSHEHGVQFRWRLATGDEAEMAGSESATERIEAEARSLLAVLDRHPDGLGGIALFTIAHVDRSRRRALDLLVARGLVRREGNTKSAVWHRVRATEPDEP